MKSDYISIKHEASRDGESPDSHPRQEPGRKKQKCFRPAATNPWTFVGILCIIASCIILLEVVLSMRQQSVTDSQVSPRFEHKRRRQIGIGPRASVLNAHLTSTVTTGMALSLTSPSPIFTKSEIARRSITSPHVSRAIFAASSCHSTLTYVFGEPDPTGCYQTTETVYATITEASQMTITHDATPTPTVGDPPPASQMEISGTFTKPDYFLALYLPTLLVVLLQTVWAVVFAATKMMEPFYQLASPDGALAEDSILSEYLSSGMSMSTLRTMFSGHWVMSLASIIHLASGILAPLASESMGVQPTATCHTAIASNQPCAPAWTVFLPTARALEALLAFLFLAVFLLLIIISRRRTSGVYENPTSIRSMINLLSDPVVQRDFREIEPNATKSVVRKALAGNRYRLGYFESATPGSHRFRLTKILPESEKEPWQAKSTQHRYAAVNDPSEPYCKDKSRLTPRWSTLIVDGLLLLVFLTLFGLILGYYLDGNQTDTLNTFFNSNSFGPRFLLSSLAVLTGRGWTAPHARLASWSRTENWHLVIPSGLGETASPLSLTPR